MTEARLRDFIKGVIHNAMSNNLGASAATEEIVLYVIGWLGPFVRVGATEYLQEEELLKRINDDSPEQFKRWMNARQKYSQARTSLWAEIKDGNPIPDFWSDPK